jgi:hypothetical protein
MKLVTFAILPFLFFYACSRDAYEPSGQLSEKEQVVVLTSIARYVVKMPKGANDSTKFHQQFNDYYSDKLKDLRLERFHRTGDDFYFLVSQTAPSLTVKRHATGGKFRLDPNGRMVFYKEVFRTWKMIPDTLQRRSYLLFDKMVMSEDLSLFQTRNSDGVEFIEFPDDKTTYDTVSRTWIFKVN